MHVACQNPYASLLKRLACKDTPDSHVGYEDDEPASGHAALMGLSWLQTVRRAKPIGIPEKI